MVVTFKITIQYELNNDPRNIMRLSVREETARKGTINNNEHATHNLQ